jgi:hypothetical protein
VSGHAKMPPAPHQVSATSLKLLIQQIHPHVRAQRAPPWATAWASSSNSRAAPRATAGRNGQVSSAHNERRCGQRPGMMINEHRPVGHNKRRCGQRPGHRALYLRGAAGNGRARRSSTCDAQRAPPREKAWTLRSSTCDAQRAAPRASVPAPNNERRREHRTGT